MESSFSTININDEDGEEDKIVKQSSKLINDEENILATATSSKSASPFNIKHASPPQSLKHNDNASISSESSSIPNNSKKETDTSRINENFYQTFSSLIIDQLNIPDVNALLDSQRNM
jgi:hypothetical protein